VQTKKTTKVTSKTEPQQQIWRQNKDEKTTTKNALSQTSKKRMNNLTANKRGRGMNELMQCKWEGGRVVTCNEVLGSCTVSARHRPDTTANRQKKPITQSV